MRLSIHVEAVGQQHMDSGGYTPEQQVEQMLRAIGYARFSANATQAVLNSTTALTPESTPDLSVLPAETADAKDMAAPVAEQADEAPKRRGRPKKQDAAPAPAEQQTDIEDAIAKAEPAQISTGDERIGPDDTPEDEVQDMADEIAETAAVPKAAPTLDDLRTVMSDYANKFGMPIIQQDGPKIFTEALGALPDGTKKADGSPATAWSLTLVPPDRIADAVNVWRQAVNGNPYERAVTGA